VLLPLLLGVLLGAADALPPPPARHFEDKAGVVSAEFAEQMDGRLRAFDEKTGSQVVVVLYPKLTSPSLEDFTVRTAQSWRVGNKKLDTGAVLFVFVADHKMRLEVGYGLEERIPDVIAKRILDDVMAPHLREGDWPGGLSAGVQEILVRIDKDAAAALPAATVAKPAAPSQAVDDRSQMLLILFVVILFIWLSRRRGGRTYGGGGYWGGGWGGGFGGGGFGGGGFGGGGGGGFSGGGGSFGGGGASGSW
jgi:uncharacterized protein